MSVAHCPECDSKSFVVTAKTVIEAHIRIDGEAKFGFEVVQSALTFDIHDAEWIELMCRKCGHVGTPDDFYVPEELTIDIGRKLYEADQEGKTWREELATKEPQTKSKPG